MEGALAGGSIFRDSSAGEGRHMQAARQGTAIIIGAGPAGLTAAVELQRHSGIKPVIIEASQAIGGISRTVCYKGNRMDIGGHRFFSKSDRVMQWWLSVMPVEAGAGDAYGQSQPKSPRANDPQTDDLVMLVRQRKSRIYFLRRFFDYPVRLSISTFRNMGLARTMRCGFSYLWMVLGGKHEERTLEDFFINRFGRQLYRTFFKSYTEKVWGVPCDKISAEWGAQRVKGLSLKAAFFKKSFHASRQARPGAKAGRDLANRAISLSQVRAGAALGTRCGTGLRPRRRNSLRCHHRSHSD
jgi:protoporphyrinogen oxidase